MAQLHAIGTVRELEIKVFVVLGSACNLWMCVFCSVSRDQNLNMWVATDTHHMHTAEGVCSQQIMWGNNWIWETLRKDMKRYSYPGRYSSITMARDSKFLEAAGGAGPSPSFSGKKKAAGKQLLCYCVWWCVHASCIAEAWISRQASVCASSNTPAPDASEKTAWLYLTVQATAECCIIVKNMYLYHFLL